MESDEGPPPLICEVASEEWAIEPVDPAADRSLEDWFATPHAVGVLECIAGFEMRRS